MNLIETIRNILYGNGECPDTKYLTERIDGDV